MIWHIRQLANLPLVASCDHWLFPRGQGVVQAANLPLDKVLSPRARVLFIGRQICRPKKSASA